MQNCRKPAPAEILSAPQSPLPSSWLGGTGHPSRNRSGNPSAHPFGHPLFCREKPQGITNWRVSTWGFSVAAVPALAWPLVKARDAVCSFCLNLQVLPEFVGPAQICSSTASSWTQPHHLPPASFQMKSLGWQQLPAKPQALAVGRGPSSASPLQYPLT